MPLTHYQYNVNEVKRACQNCQTAAYCQARKFTAMTEGAAAHTCQNSAGKKFLQIVRVKVNISKCEMQFQP